MNEELRDRFAATALSILGWRLKDSVYAFEHKSPDKQEEWRKAQLLLLGRLSYQVAEGMMEAREELFSKTQNQTTMGQPAPDITKPALPDIEAVSAKVHEAWIESKKAKGVTSRKSETDEELMVPYDQLSEAAKDLDRNTVRAVYEAIQSL